MLVLYHQVTLDGSKIINGEIWGVSHLTTAQNYYVSRPSLPSNDNVHHNHMIIF